MKKVTPYVIGQLINISGRQRMLSQRISFFLVKSIKDLNEQSNDRDDSIKKYLDALNLFSNSHKELTSGDPGLFSTSLYEIFHSEDHNTYNRVNEFIQNNRVAYSILNDEKRIPDEKLLFDILKESSFPLLNSLNNIVTVYEEESKKISEEIDQEREERNLKLEQMINQLQEQELQLIDLNKNLEHKVEERTIELKTEKDKINNILNSIDQGILIINKDNTINDQISKSTYQILERDHNEIASQNFFDLFTHNTSINEEQLSFISTCFITSFGEENWVWELNCDNLPKLVTLKEKHKYLQLEWSPLLDDDNIITNVILTIKDITKEKELEEKKKQQSEMIEVLESVTQVGADKVLEYTTRSNDKIKEILSSKNIQETTKNLHSIKGEARILGLNTISLTVHDIESNIAKFNEQNSFDSILSDITLLKNKLDQICDLVTKYFGGQKSESQTDFYSIIAPHLKDLKTRLSKNKINFKSIMIEDKILHWNKKTLSLLDEVFLHLFTNATDHGFLNTDKKVDPAIKIEAYQTDEFFKISFSDNGNGISKDFLDKYGENAYDVIFDYQVSTAKTLTQTSGRGVGLSQLRALLQDTNGNINACQNMEGGLTFNITLRKGILQESKDAA